MGDTRDFLYRAKFQDDVTSAHEDMISRAVASTGRMGEAERAWNDEIKQVRTSIIEQRDALVLRKEALEDPAMKQAILESRALQEEIKQLTKATAMDTEADQLNARSKRELIVAGRELAMGNTARLPGTLSVLAESDGGITGSLKAAVAMLGGPYVVAAGAAALATVGVAAAMWKASEASAENWHQMKQLGETLGVSGDAMLGFQQLSVGTTVSTEELARTFGRFEVNIGKNAEKLRDLGISAKDPMEAFEELMDKAAGMADATQRNLVLDELLGKGWEKLTPDILQGGQAMRDAIAAMKIPDDVKADYDQANADQIAIDKNWMLMKEHAGEYFASLRAGFKDREAWIVQAIAQKGMLGGLWEIEGGYDPSAVKHAAPKKDLASYGDQGPTEEQKKNLEWLQKQGSKDSLRAELQAIHDEYAEKAQGFAEDSEQYKAFMRQELQAEDDEKTKWAKSHRDRTKADRTPSEADSEFEKATGISYGAYSMANPGGTEADVAGPGASVTKGEQSEQAKAKAEAAKKDDEDYKKYLKEAQDASANSTKIQLGWEKTLTTGIEKENEQRRKSFESYANVVQQLGATMVADSLKGTLTITKAETMAKDAAIQMIAERSTKYIETLVEDAIFGDAQQAAQTAAMTASMATIAAAAAPAAAGVSIATAGGADAAATASLPGVFFLTQGLASHAAGGFEFGRQFIAHEQGAERITQVAPSQITPASHTVNNMGETHFHFHGYTVEQIAPILTRAQNAQLRTRGQTSRS